MLSEREQSNLQKIPNTVIGVVAHVDAGKTTLSEAILYNTGVLRSLGSVDAGSTALDTDELEKARGITIFSSEAHFQIEGRDFTLPMPFNWPEIRVIWKFLKEKLFTMLYV